MTLHGSQPKPALDTLLRVGRQTSAVALYVPGRGLVLVADWRPAVPR